MEELRLSGARSLTHAHTHTFYLSSPRPPLVPSSQVKLLGPNVDPKAVAGVAKSAKIFYPPKNFPLVSRSYTSQTSTKALTSRAPTY